MSGGRTAQQEEGEDTQACQRTNPVSSDVRSDHHHLVNGFIPN